MELVQFTPIIVLSYFIFVTWISLCIWPLASRRSYLSNWVVIPLSEPVIKSYGAVFNNLAATALPFAPGLAHEACALPVTSDMFICWPWSVSSISDVWYTHWPGRPRRALQIPCQGCLGDTARMCAPNLIENNLQPCMDDACSCRWWPTSLNYDTWFVPIYVQGARLTHLQSFVYASFAILDYLVGLAEQCCWC